MDMQVIDQSFGQLQAQAQQTVQALQTLGNKLQAAANGGDAQAREWLLDLKEVALSFQGEQQQVTALLQGLHAGMSNAPQQEAAAPAPAAPAGGFFGNLLNSSFGQAMETGAGFGIGDDLIHKIF
ncbi:hypothetical protein AA0472_0040 [Acetobacter estunensis NRIC 0472]|uniref:Uncharacterized protein n=1 Tax=Acetobacter estunensis TaxID=104097 RepID=A0A967EBR5_9PROT|nr:hypothetical protein [Acetobacter estunensis]NHO53768.1 hypothetical protein [Acetobacter estunensis]GBQ20112.1 hypothetical protein AA0472_0040 [Acetobacter estunensis NRIC 0472]